MREMVGAGEVDHFVPERAWQELSRGPDGRTPLADARGAAELRRAGTHPAGGRRAVRRAPAARHHPEVDTGLHTLLVIDYAASRHFALPVRFAALTHDLGKGETPQGALAPSHRSRGARRRADRRVVRAAARAQRLSGSGPAGDPLSRRDPSRLGAKGLDHRQAVRDRPTRYGALNVSRCFSRLRERFHGRPGFESLSYAPAPLLRNTLQAARQRGCRRHRRSQTNRQRSRCGARGAGARGEGSAGAALS